MPSPRFNRMFPRVVEDDGSILHEPLSTYERDNSSIGSAPSGYGREYDQLFANNPYRDLTYHESAWQRFLSSLGFRTGYDAWLENTQVQANEFDAGIFSQMFQNQYNSEVAKAMRMRAAGQNPDLLGTGDVENAASPSEDVNGMPEQTGDEDALLSLCSGVAQQVMQIIPSALSFATNLSQLKGIRIENDSKELNFAKGAKDAAAQFFLEGITPEMYKEAFDTGNYDNILDAAEKDSSYFADTMLSSKVARKRYKLAYGMHSRSLLAEVQKYQTYDEFEKARKDLLSQRAHPWFSDNDSDMQSLLSSFIGPIDEFNKRQVENALARQNKRKPEMEQQLENLQMQNQLAYENALDPNAQASAENAVNRYTEQQNQLLEDTNQLFTDIMNNLKQNDNWFSKIAMALLGIARAQILSGMSMSFGRQNHVDASGVSTSSSSLNVGF